MMEYTLTKENGRLCYGVMGLKLEFCLVTGAWLKLSGQGVRVLDGDSLLPPVTLTVGGVSTVTTGRDHLWNIRDTVAVGAGLRLSDFYVEEGPTLHLVLAGEGWTIDQRFAANPEKGRLERSMRLDWNGPEEVLLRWAEMRMPTVRDEQQCTLELPGYSDFLHEKCSELPMGTLPTVPFDIDKDAANWRPGVLAAVYDDVTLISWLYGEDMPAFWQIERGYRGTWLEQKWLCSCRMNPGDSLEVGVQYLRTAFGPLREELGFMPDFWDEMGIRLPNGTRPWARRPFIYEAHVGPKSFPVSKKTYTPYPTLPDLTCDLPRIAELGFTVLELMPRFSFPGYMVHDYFDIAVCYGPVEQMRELVSTAHNLGMKVFLDVIMHGVADKTVRPNAIHARHPLLDQHPEFFSYSEDGRTLRTYTWAFDHANPQLRQYCKEAFLFYVRELDVDGFRVDALTWNYFPNWRKGLPYPAYKAIDGSFGMFTEIRAALEQLKPDIALYSESTGPLMAKSYDLSYVYDEIWMYECLMPPILPNLPPKMHLNRYDGGRLVDGRGAAEWLDLRQKVLPRGWIKVHQADSHDSHEWLGIGLFRRDYFGLKQSRALFAYCNFVEGGVMNFTGGENGSEAVYKDLIAKRKSFKALLEGSCDYVAITSENRHLFAPLRVKEEQILIPVINFSLEEADSTLCLDALQLDPDASYRLTEHFSGKTLTGKGRDFAQLPVHLEGYGYQLWQVETLG